MKHWPVPESYSKELPKKGEAGSFWERRDGRYHCGIDIYAPLGSRVLAVEGGIVIDIGIFTSPERIPYWNFTYYIIIEHESGVFCKYAELGSVEVKVGDRVEAGQLIGKVGLVLNPAKISEDAPLYIRSLRENKRTSMLHFEVLRNPPFFYDRYLGGNWFGEERPDNFMDPMEFLKDVVKD